MEIKLTPKAEKDLEDISTYLTLYFPEKAGSTYYAIQQACNHLIELPAMGKVGKVEGTREVKISKLPYLLIYRLKKNELQILRIYHNSRKPIH